MCIVHIALHSSNVHTDTDIVTVLTFQSNAVMSKSLILVHIPKRTACIFISTLSYHDVWYLISNYNNVTVWLSLVKLMSLRHSTETKPQLSE